MNWKAIACSEIGTSHQKQNLPCQDCGKFNIIGNAIIGVVADGAGSAKYSDIGAKLAVDTVLEAIKAEEITDLENIVCSLQDKSSKKKKKSAFPWRFSFRQSKSTSESTINTSPELKKELIQQELNNFFSNVVQKVKKALEKQADEQQYFVNDLACTLLIVIASSQCVVAMQIGDGFIVVRYPDNDPQLLFPPDKGEYLNETTFVTSNNVLEEMRVSIELGQPKFICASTDGLERLAIQIKDWVPYAPFFKPLEQYLTTPNNDQDSKQYVLDFLQSPKLNARTDDDKTLFLTVNERDSNLPQE